MKTSGWELGSWIDRKTLFVNRSMKKILKAEICTQPDMGTTCYAHVRRSQKGRAFGGSAFLLYNQVILSLCYRTYLLNC